MHDNTKLSYDKIAFHFAQTSIKRTKDVTMAKRKSVGTEDDKLLMLAGI